MKLPSAFENNMIKMIGEEDFELYKEALAKTVRHALRVNTGKISVEDFIFNLSGSVVTICFLSYLVFHILH